MAQFARPSSDVSTGSWTTTPLWSKVDEVTASDSDFISSDNNTSGDTCQLGLSSVTDPGLSTGHVVRYRYRKSGSGGHTIDVVVELRQGATLIASQSHSNIGNTFTAGSFTLSTSEANAITDYSALQLHFIRNGDTGGSPGNRRSLEISWAELEVPDVNTDREGLSTWAELEVPDAPRRGRSHWAELEVGNAPRLGRVTWAELEVEDAPRSGTVTWAELEVSNAPREGRVSWAALEAPDTTRTGRLHWSELETSDAPRSATVSWAELEVPTAPRAGLVTWAEFEIATAPRSGVVTWAEVEIPTAPREGLLTWAELESPTPPLRGRVFWAHFSIPNTNQGVSRGRLMHLLHPDHSITEII